MSFYECTFILRPELTRGDIEKTTKELSDIISAAKGKNIKEEYWGLRVLAYKIAKNSRGHYVHLAIQANGSIINELKRISRINETIMSNLIIKVDEIDKEPSVLMPRTDRRDAA